MCTVSSHLHEHKFKHSIQDSLENKIIGIKLSDHSDLLLTQILLGDASSDVSTNSSTFKGAMDFVISSKRFEKLPF